MCPCVCHIGPEKKMSYVFTQNPISQAVLPRACVHLEGCLALICTRALSRPVVPAHKTKVVGLESLTLNTGCHSRCPWAQDRVITTEVNLKLFLFFTSLTQGLSMTESNGQASALYLKPNCLGCGNASV